MGIVTVMEELECVTFRFGSAACTVAKFGATVIKWECCGAERLWISTLSPMDGSAPIRGGIPIAFPQFADQGHLTLHGFAREQIWNLDSIAEDTQSTTAIFSLLDNTRTRDLWNYSFALQYTVTITEESLKMTLSVKNTSDSSFAFTGCLHTYFRTPDINKVSLVGLAGISYIDKVAARSVRVDDVNLKIADASVASGGYVDRIYLSPPNEIELQDENVLYRIHQSASFVDTVVFNPWEIGKKGPQHPDFDDDGFNYMICVEPAIASREIVLGPNDVWEGTQLIEIFVQ